MNHQIQSLTLTHVHRAYRGRSGCMCGCRGKYYTPGITGDRHADECSKISPRACNGILEDLKAADRAGSQIDVKLDGDVRWASFDDDDRNLTVYLNDAGAKHLESAFDPIALGC